MRLPHFFLLFFLFFGLLFSGTGQELKIPDVSLKSNYQAQLDPPKFRHETEILSPVYDESPFSPNFAADPDLNIPVPPVNASKQSSLFGSKTSLRDEKELYDGIAAAKEKNFAEAKDRLLQLAKENDDTGLHAKIWLCWISLQTGDRELFLNASKVLKDRDNYYYSSEGYTCAAQFYLLQKDPESARELSQEWKKEKDEPRSFKMLYYNMYAAMQTGKTEEAQTDARELIRRFRYSARLPYVMETYGDLLYQNEKYPEAENVYRELTEVFPDFPKQDFIAYKRAWNFYRSDQPAKSLEFLLKVDPERLPVSVNEYRYFRMLLALKENSQNKALRFFSEINPDSEWKEHAALVLIQNPETYRGKSAIENELENFPFGTSRAQNLNKLEQANRLAKANELNQAELIYLSVLDDTSDDILSGYANLNLAQVLFLQNNPEGTETMLQDKFEDPKVEMRRIYHLYHSLYLQKKDSELLKLHNRIGFEGWNRETRSEIDLTVAIALARTGKIEEALKASEESWKLRESNLAFGFFTHLKFYRNDFQGALDNQKLYKKKPNQYLLKQWVKSAIALERPKTALKLLKPFQQSESFEIRKLYIEAWQADGANREIIRKVPDWMRKSSEDPEIAYYSAALGDAYYNEGNYDAAAATYKKTIHSKDIQIRSAAYLNWLNALRVSKKDDALEKTGAEALKKKLGDEERFEIVNLMAKHYREKKQYGTADQYYAQYIQFFPYHSNDMRLNRAQMLFEIGTYPECLKITEKPWEKETAVQATDRRLFAARCAIALGEYNFAQQTIAKETQSKSNYREFEKQLLSAEIYIRQGKYQESLKILDRIEPQAISDTQKQEVKRLRILNFAKTDQWDKIAKFKLSDFTNSNYRTELALIRARSLWKTGKKEETISVVSRQLYNTSSASERALVRVHLSDYLLASGKKEAAITNFKKIDSTQLLSKADLNYYENLKKRLF